MFRIRKTERKVKEENTYQGKQSSKIAKSILVKAVRRKAKER